ncbi:hypothetical protein AK812_SmicGene5088 [Symbiodinium microadriaticum]|uniref:Uncharacterized protein n=1 Tax=Symbiodinium microadriaticum TaxID=2951 RepID=A0A1Q9EUL3_SYMMI|nr:hypothetical protein AK812_SmicGene5088 [Symbiodinium microadriaticum]
MPIETQVASSVPSLLRDLLTALFFEELRVYQAAVIRLVVLLSRVSLHLLPSCVDELLQQIAAPNPPPNNDDIALARRLESLSPYKLNLLLHGWEPELYPGALKNAVIRFLGMGRDAQLRVLDKFQDPVYMFTPPPKVRGGLQQLDHTLR